jgi:hypothetical protein
MQRCYGNQNAVMPNQSPGMPKRMQNAQGIMPIVYKMPDNTKDNPHRNSFPKNMSQSSTTTMNIKMKIPERRMPNEVHACREIKSRRREITKKMQEFTLH